MKDAAEAEARSDGRFEVYGFDHEVKKTDSLVRPYAGEIRAGGSDKKNEVGGLLRVVVFYEFDGGRWYQQKVRLSADNGETWRDYTGRAGDPAYDHFVKYLSRTDYGPSPAR
jgi:hypothetical protein